MDTFRLTLIFVGLAVLFIIYLLEAARRRKLRERRNRPDQPPSLDGGPFPDGLADDQPNLGLRIPHPGGANAGLHTDRNSDLDDDLPPAPPIGAGLLQAGAPSGIQPAGPVGMGTPAASPIPTPDAGMSAAWQPGDADTSPTPPADPMAAAAVTGNPFLSPEDLEPVPGADGDIDPAAAAAPATVPDASASPHPAAAESDEAPEPPEGFSDLIIALQISARDGGNFSGRDIQSALRHCELEYGEMKIYHYYTPRRRSLFFLANSVEPGSFDLTTITSMSTPGVLFFLRLPTVLAGRDAFEIMLDVAGRVAERLDGDLQDQQGHALGKHELTGIRERIAAYEYKLKAHERQMAALG